MVVRGPARGSVPPSRLDPRLPYWCGRITDVPALMVQGTSSWAGKSLIATALCRHLARQGARVVPFKAQNMSNNARVVDGGEIGVAQYLQSLAARADPDVRMNPVL